LAKQLRLLNRNAAKHLLLSPACDTLCSGPASANPRASDTFATLSKRKLAMRNFGTITYGLIVQKLPKAGTHNAECVTGGVRFASDIFGII
jgi:hypothetical protein